MFSERSAIVEYYEYGHYDERPHFETANAEIETAMGYGKCLIQLDQENSLVYDLVVNCQYNPNISCVPTKSYKAIDALREHLRFKCSLRTTEAKSDPEFYCEPYRNAKVKDRSLTRPRLGRKHLGSPPR
jgi:hypothetical protein